MMVSNGSQYWFDMRKRSRWITRRRLLALCVVAVSLGLWWGTPSFHWCVNRGAAVVYTAYDRMVGRTNVAFGPAADGATTTDDISRGQTLSRWFPQYAFECSGQSGELPRGPNLRFQHEDVSNDQVKLFADEASSLMAGDPDVFQLAQRTRSLTAHGPNDLDLGALPLTYLRLAKQGNAVSCYHFAMIYSSACICRGYTARVLGLSQRGTARDHAVAEVYVPE